VLIQSVRKFSVADICSLQLSLEVSARPIPPFFLFVAASHRIISIGYLTITADFR
jgi:hypothetical protein